METDENIKSFTIKVYPSEEARFRKIVSGMDDIETLRAGLVKLMDNYEYPKTVHVDNPELIKQNQELQDEIDELMEANRNLAAQVEGYEAKIKSWHDEKAQRPSNVFEVDVHPVAFHFLKQMADDLKVEPGYILTDLFIRDLQNPRANNLPYIVPSSEIRAKMEEYKKAHVEDGKEA